MSRIIPALAIAAACLAASSADAQLVTYYSPVVAAPVVPAVAPVVAAPVPTVVARPVVTYAARPIATVAYSPVRTVAYSPVSTVAYRPVAPVVTSVPVYTTRWRPLLGGTVTRVRYAPVVAY